MTADSPGLPDPAPAFAQHFTDPLYDDVGDGRAPFGSDEGSDLLWSWRDRRDELGSASTLATVLACEPSSNRELRGPDGRGRRPRDRNLRHQRCLRPAAADRSPQRR